MRYEIASEPEAEYEVLGALTRHATRLYTGVKEHQRVLPEAADYYCKKYLLDEQQRAEQFAPLEALSAHIVDGLALDETTERQFFCPLCGEPDLLVPAQALGYAIRYDRTCAQSLPCFLGDDWLASDALTAATLEELVQLLERIHYPTGARYAVIELWVNWDKHIAVLRDIIDRGVRLYREKYDVVRPLVERWRVGTEAAIAQKGIEAHLRSFQLELNEDLRIVPCLFQFSAISITALDEGDMTLFYGVLCDFFVASSDPGDRLLPVLRALGDKKRLQIVLALRGKTLYAQDLIALTGLTAATVSHHISELVNAGLISVKKEGVRISYFLRTDETKSFIDLLRDTLL